MKIVLLSPLQHNYPGEAQIVTELFKRGLSAYLLDKPYYKTNTMEQFLNQIPATYHKRIILHSHHILLRKFDLAGLHDDPAGHEHGLQAWWNKKRLERYMRNKEKSTTCKKLSDLQNLARLNYSYVLYDLEAENLAGEYADSYALSIKNALKHSSTRVLAVGENGTDYIRKAFGLGFYGIVLKNSIWDQPDPLVSFDSILQCCQEIGVLME